MSNAAAAAAAGAHTHAPNTHFHTRTHIQHARPDANVVGAGNLNMQRVLSLRPSVRGKSGLLQSIDVHLPTTLGAATLDADADDASPSPRLLLCAAGVRRAAAGEAHDRCQDWDMLASRASLWIVISTGSGKEAVRASPPEEGGAASVKGAALRSCRRLTFITVH